MDHGVCFHQWNNIKSSSLSRISVKNVLSQMGVIMVWLFQCGQSLLTPASTCLWAEVWMKHNLILSGACHPDTSQTESQQHVSTDMNTAHQGSTLMNGRYVTTKHYIILHYYYYFIIFHSIFLNLFFIFFFYYFLNYHPQW